MLNLIGGVGKNWERRGRDSGVGPRTWYAFIFGGTVEPTPAFLTPLVCGYIRSTYSTSSGFYTSPAFGVLLYWL